jgi:hypothetical protein
LPAISLPWLTPRLSAMWLKLVTRADYALARELVFGLTEDLLPEADDYWRLIDKRPTTSFEAAARAALDAERDGGPRRGLGSLEEALVRRVGPRLRAW